VYWSHFELTIKVRTTLYYAFIIVCSVHDISNSELIFVKSIYVYVFHIN